MKDYLLFDLDGTLTDPKLGITSCVQYALRSFGIEEPDLDKLEPFIGPPLKDSFMEFYGLDEEKAEEAVAKYRERFQETGLFENEIYTGIKEMLRTLKKKGMHLAVASSKPTIYVERILEHFKIRKYFEVVVGSELDGRRVNKDEVVQEALSQLFSGNCIDRDRVYMIGDRKFDVEGARAQGVESIGVSYGYGSIEELKEARADYIVRSVKELERFLFREFTDSGKQGFFQELMPLLGPVLLLMVIKNIGHVWFLLTGSMFHGNGNLLLITFAFVLVGLGLRRTARWYLVRGEEVRYLSHLRQESNAQYLYLLLGSLGVMLGTNALIVLTGLTMKETIHYIMVFAQDIIFRSFYLPQFEISWLLGMLCTVVIIPIVEDVVFRGILHNGLRENMRAWPAILGSSLLFGVYQLYQGDGGIGLYAFVLGLLLAFTYEYFCSFRLTVVMHMMSAFFLYLSTCRPGNTPLYTWPVCMISLLAGVVFMVMLLLKKRIH